MLNRVFSLFKKKKVYALVGRSGTGKSFRAKLIAQKYQIDYIIDDGLLIYKNSIIGGKSAKREEHYIKAIKTAIFEDKDHCNTVASLIRKHNPSKILLIGTSDKMVKIICAKIGLPNPFKIIKIEDISSQEEIKRALNSREVDGKHVIPVPTLEIKKNYPNIIAEKLEMFIKHNFKSPIKKTNNANSPKLKVEKSIIRPDFTQKGSVVLSDSALAQMIYHCTDEFNSEYNIKKLTIKKVKNKYHTEISVIVPIGHGLASHLQEYQTYIISSIEKYTGIMIGKLDIELSEIK